MKYIGLVFALIFTIFSSGEVYSADTYEVGDTLYVWARGGL